MLSVIIPVFNEEKTISEIISRLLSQKVVREIVVVDDGSWDRTGKILTLMQRRVKGVVGAPRFQVLSQKNKGKGSAIRAGLKQVTMDYVLIQDADLEYDPEDIEVLIEPILRGKAEVVYGSRFLGAHMNLLFWHKVGNSFLNFCINILYNTTLSDMETCYKIMPTKKWHSLNLGQDDFRIEPEITCKLLRQGEKIYEVPISYAGRDFSEGKKITWKDGLLAIPVIISHRIRRS